MLPQNINNDCKEAFLELIFQTSTYQGRTWCFFMPYRSKKKSYHITVVEKSSGFGTVVPLMPKAIMLLEKENMKDIYYKVLKGLMIAVNKEDLKKTPVDYKKAPLTAGGKTSKFEKGLQL